MSQSPGVHGIYQSHASLCQASDRNTSVVPKDGSLSMTTSSEVRPHQQKRNEGAHSCSSVHPFSLVPRLFKGLYRHHHHNYVVHQRIGGTRSYLCRLPLQAWDFAIHHRVTLQAVCIPSEHNFVTDCLSRSRTQLHKWMLHIEVFLDILQRGEAKKLPLTTPPIY